MGANLVSNFQLSLDAICVKLYFVILVHKGKTFILIPLLSLLLEPTVKLQNCGWGDNSLCHHGNSCGGHKFIFMTPFQDLEDNFFFIGCFDSKLGSN